MIADRQLDKIAAVIAAAAVFLCLLVMAHPEAVSVSSSGLTMEYESGLFDTESIMEIDIVMEENDWEEMLQNAMSETYYTCDVAVNGTTYYNVGIRPKGNTSLSAIAMDPDSDRYSFKLEFDRYVEGQTCQGLDKLVLNNNYADATNSKEAVVYDMYRYLDVDASLYNYAKISVNGDYWGVYLALEAVEDSFALRNYGVEKGNLYKPEGMGMGRGKGERSGGRGGPGGGGADLNYVDEELESYTTIWEGEVTEGSDADHRRVVTALRNISQGTNLEDYLDVDNILKYMAVHSFSVNEDSLSGSMAHNYYLYEHDGRLNILPWDYNLAFGGMGMGKQDSTIDMINDPVDTPFSGTQFFDALLENEVYLERYHTYYRQLVEEYVFGGGFEETFRRIRSQIDGLVREDPNAMYSYEEYEAAADMLYETVMLRSESVLGQLDGTIPSTVEGQKENDGALLAAAGIDVSVMGTMSMGGGPSGGGSGRGREEFPDNGFPEGEMDAVPVMAWAPIEGELPDAQIQPPKGERPGPEGIPGREGGMPPEGMPGREGGIPSEGLPQRPCSSRSFLQRSCLRSMIEESLADKILSGYGCQKPRLRSASGNLHKKVVRLPLCGAFR